MQKAETQLENVDVKIHVEKTAAAKVVAPPAKAEDSGSDYETEADLNDEEKAIYEEKFANYI